MLTKKSTQASYIAYAFREYGVAHAEKLSVVASVPLTGRTDMWDRATNTNRRRAKGTQDTRPTQASQRLQPKPKADE